MAEDDEFEELLRVGRGIAVEIRMSFLDAMLLVSAVQLALRHPANCGEPAHRVEAICRFMLAGLDEQVPGIAAFMGRGWPVPETLQ